MTGRQRVINAIRRQEVDRAPWVPFVGCHAGSLLGVSAEEYLKSTDLIVRGVQESIRRYSPDGVPVMFDLQIEAELFGCKLNWAKEVPPSVVSHPLAEGVKLESLKIPEANEGRLATTLEATRQLRQANPDIALYGLITGPFTLALHLRGTDIFTMMFDEPQEIAKLMAFCRDVCKATATYFIQAGCDVVAVVDPMTSQVGPDQFRQHVTPAAKPIFDHIRDSGSLGSFFVCGHALQNVVAMCECRPDNISVDENIPLFLVRDTCLDMGVSFGGNLKLTTVLLLGKPHDARKNAVECLEIAGKEGFILSPGCDLPYATPPENLIAVANVVMDTYQREVAKSLAPVEGEADTLDMRDYGQSGKVIVDIITLDSEACAPCQYMVESVRQIAPEFDGLVEWREHKIKRPESLVFMTSLMVHNIPTICIDGVIKFVSRIPKREDLVAAIQERLYEKLRIRIKRRRSAIYVLGPDDDRRRTLLERIETAMTELGEDMPIHTITNEEEIQAYGVTRGQTPAVMLARYNVKSLGETPETAIIKEWLKDLQQ